MKKIFISALSLVFVLTQVSCNDEEVKVHGDNTTPASIESTNNTVLDQNSINNTEQNDLESSVNNTNNLPSSSAPSEKLNPPHGQPGHRCDIPEGAPLSTPPQQQAQAHPIQDPAANPANIAPNAPSLNVQPPAQQTAPGFSGKPNPEHGQPGHRCDLQVGAILP